MSDSKSFRERMDELLRDGLPDAPDHAFTAAYIERAAIAIQKAQGWIPVSCCLMTDATGENHCDHPAPPPPPWRLRAKWRIQSWWSSLRMRVGSWVAGVDLGERED